LTSAGASGAAAFGTYPIVPSAAVGSGLDKYTISYANGTLTVGKVLLTITASDRTKTYGDAVTFAGTEFTTAGLINGDVVTSVTLTSAGASAAAAVGTYSIAPSAAIGSGLNNYTISYSNGTLSVGKAALTIKASDRTKTYGDAINFAGTEFTTTGLVNGDAVSSVTLTSSGASASAVVGTYPIVSSAALGIKLENYTVSYVNGNLTIARAGLIIKADNKSKAYGDVIPVLTVTYSGLVNGDLAPATPPTITTTATAASPVGTYPITAFNAVDVNYNISYVGANLTITTKSITATAAPKTKVYGDADPVLTYTFAPALIGTDAFTGSLTRATGENVGPYAISKGTLALSSNYSLSFVGANLTITPRPITVTADAKSKEMGTADPALTYKITSGNLAFTDAFSGSLSRDPGETVGTYLIRQGTLALNSNYNLTFVGANFTITVKTVLPTVTVSPSSAQYSDMVTFTANISLGTILISGRPHPEAYVTFKVGTQEMGTVPLKVKGLDLEGKLTTVLLERIKGQMAPGNKTVSAIFSFNDFRIKVTPNPAVTTLMITQEDARVNINGTYLQSALSFDSKSWDDNRLKATVMDITAMRDDPAYDFWAGDIRNAKVRFLNGSAPATNWMTPDLVNGRDSKTGIVSSKLTDLGLTKDVPNDINTEVGGTGYYVRNNAADVSIVTLYVPTSDYVTGGGYLINPNNTSGTYAGDPGLKTNFGFVVKYKNKGTNLQGTLDIIFRRTVAGDVHTYQIKSTTLTSIGVNMGYHHSLTSEILSGANLTDITNPGAPVLLGSKLKLQVDLSDNSDSGDNDRIGISLMDGSTLLFSSNWNGSSTMQKPIDDGNIIIHSGSSFGNSINTSENNHKDHILSSELGVKAYPNPFSDHVNFDLQLATDSKVRLEIYDITGSKVATLFDDVALAYNQYQLQYTPEKHSGILIYRLIIDDKIAFTGKLIHK
jgi:hypothetical protein